jgi:hypothetical protein
VKTQKSEAPFYSLAVRKAAMISLAAPLVAVFAVMLLHHKGIFDIEAFGLPENYLYYGGFAVLLVGVVVIVVVWRCPGCGSYLGKNTSPARCAHCGARFQ